MIIDHPRRMEILDVLGRRCRAEKIPYYRLELLPAPDKGWDARLDIAGGGAQYELAFLNIVNDVRQQFARK